MKSGAGFTKDGKGIFSYTCGGSHLLQAVAHGYGMGFGGICKEKFWKFKMNCCIIALFGVEYL